MEYPRFTSSERTPTQENISREKKEVGAKLTGRLYLLLAAKINGGDAPLTTVPEEWINAPGQSYDIHIQGDEAFTQRTKEAFEVLRANAADFHTFVKQNIGIIQQVKRGSRMDASELIPVFFAGDNGSQGGKKWYAGAMVHEAWHSYLYRQWQREHPGEIVPLDEWTGKAVEQQCLNLQYGALVQLKASPVDLLQIRNAINTRYWEVPVEKRSW